MNAETKLENYRYLVMDESVEIVCFDVFDTALLTVLPVRVVQENQIEEIFSFFEARKSMLELYHLAKEYKKQVVFADESGYEECVIRELLVQNGYHGDEKIYTIQDGNYQKEDASLFQHIAEDLQINPQKILYFCDQWDSDYIGAQTAGFLAVHIPRPYEEFINLYDQYGDGVVGITGKKLRELLDEEQDIKTQIINTTIANFVFDDPFSPREVVDVEIFELKKKIEEKLLNYPHIMNLYLRRVEKVKDLVSVVVNVCVEKGLAICLKSILEQTYNHLEVLVDNRQQVDVTDALAAFNDGRIMLMLQSEVQETERFFWQAAGARGEYILYMNGGDVLSKDYIREMVAQIQQINKAISPEWGYIDDNERKYVGEKNPDIEHHIGVMMRNEIPVIREYMLECVSKEDIKKGIGCNYYIRTEEKLEDADLMDSRLDDIKYKILNPAIKVISFDVFDTLVLRPFYNPVDLFQLLDKEFEKLVGCNISFSKIRVDAEAYLRRKIYLKEIKEEDITLTEIYTAIREQYGIEDSIVQKMMESEKTLELKYCNRRETGASLFKLARFMRKRIIIVSDMYLERDAIEAILLKNGYIGYEKIFVSSEYKKLKGTGSLYGAVLSELQVQSAEILHIGDNWQNDCVVAEKNGLVTAHLPKAMDVFLNEGGAYNTNACGHIAEKICTNFIDYEEIQKSIGYGCMMAMVANKYFDNPFRNFDKKSDFNKDAYLIGYYLLGMHMMGLVKWLEDIAHEKHYTKIIFTARDGWLLQKAYEIYRSYHEGLPVAEYYYVSRKAVLPAMLENRLDFYDLPIKVTEYTPEKLLKLLMFCTKPGFEQEVNGMCEEIGIEANQYFDEGTFNQWMRLFLERLYDETLHKDAIEPIRLYFKDVTEDMVFFDMGYSGRIQKALCYATGKKLDAIFVHSDAKRHYSMQRKGKFGLKDYYDFIPYMYDALREYMLSDIGASCKAYEVKDMQASPVFEEVPEMALVALAEKMQRGALDFVREYLANFSEYEQYVTYKTHEVSMPFEAFLRYCSDADREIFSCVEFEDEVYGGESKINMKEMLEARLEWLPTYAK